MTHLRPWLKQKRWFSGSGEGVRFCRPAWLPGTAHTAGPAGAALRQALGDTGAGTHLKARDSVCTRQLLSHNGCTFFSTSRHRRKKSLSKVVFHTLLQFLITFRKEKEILRTILLPLLFSLRGKERLIHINEMNDVL